MDTNVVQLYADTELSTSAAHNPKLGDMPVVVDISDKHNMVIFVDSRRVRPLPDQPRQAENEGFSEESIAELAEAIDSEGQIEPVLITLPKERGWDADLVDGERRLRACRHGHMMILARVDTTIVDPEEHFVKSVMANFHRVGHTSVEVMYAIRRMQKTRTIDQIAKVFGRSRAWVEQHISLLRLDESLHPFLVGQEVESDVAPSEEDAVKKAGRKVTGKLTFQIAGMLAGVPREDQLTLAKVILGKRMPYDAARRYVHAYLDQNKLLSGKQKRPPSEMFRALERLVDTASNRFGYYVDKNPRELQELFATQPIKETQVLAQDLRFLGSMMEDLAVILNPHLKKK